MTLESLRPVNPFPMGLVEMQLDRSSGGQLAVGAFYSDDSNACIFPGVEFGFPSSLAPVIHQ